MLKFLGAMILPVYVGVYTVLFGRWLAKRRPAKAAVSAYVLAGVSFGLTAVIFWKLLV